MVYTAKEKKPMINPAVVSEKMTDMFEDDDEEEEPPAVPMEMPLVTVPQPIEPSM